MLPVRSDKMSHRMLSSETRCIGGKSTKQGSDTQSRNANILSKFPLIAASGLASQMLITFYFVMYNLFENKMASPHNNGGLVFNFASQTYTNIVPIVIQKWLWTYRWQKTDAPHRKTMYNYKINTIWKGKVVLIQTFVHCNDVEVKFCSIDGRSGAVSPVLKCVFLFILDLFCFSGWDTFDANKQSAICIYAHCQCQPGWSLAVYVWFASVIWRKSGTTMDTS